MGVQVGSMGVVGHDHDGGLVVDVRALRQRLGRAEGVYLVGMFVLCCGSDSIIILSSHLLALT